MDVNASTASASRAMRLLGLRLLWGAVAVATLVTAIVLGRDAGEIHVACGEPAGAKEAAFLWAAALAGMAFIASIVGSVVSRRRGLLVFVAFVGLGCLSFVVAILYLIGALLAEPICLS